MAARQYELVPNPGSAALAGLRQQFAPLGPWRLADEVSAAALVTATAVPLSIGLAAVAGVPPVAGLLTCVWPLVLFALLGSSPHLKVGLDASSAALIAATVPAVVAGDPDRYLPLAAVMTAMAGLIIVAAGLWRLGVLADLLALPVLVGYTAGIAISVIISQLPRMLGYSATGTNDITYLTDVIANLSETQIATALLAVGSLVSIALLRRFAPTLPAAAVVLVAGIVVSWTIDLQELHVATVGDIPSGLPRPSVPQASASEWLELLGPAAGVALVIAADSVITSRSFAARLGYHVDANKDLRGIGAANVASSLTGGVIASASYAGTAVAERSGSRSQVSGVLAALIMAVVLLALTGVLAEVPLAVLAAVVVDAVARLIDPRDFVRLARVRRPEAVIAVLTAVGVLVIGLLPTIVLAISCSLLLALVDLAHAWKRHTEKPDHMRFGRFETTKGAVGSARRFAWHGPLLFLNTGRFRQHAIEVAVKDDVELTDLVMDAHDVTMLDATAADALAELEADLATRGTTFITDGLAPDFARRLAASRGGRASSG